MEVRKVIKIYKGPKGFPEKNQIAINNLSYSFKPGQICIIMGRNGSGKTTLLNICNGTLEPETGLVLLEGESLYNLNKIERWLVKTKKIYYIKQNIEENLFFDLTIDQNLEILKEFKGVSNEKISQLLHEFKLGNRKMVAVKKLSGGEKQKFALICALLQETKVLLIDEPTSFLDKNAKHDLMQALVKITRSANITTIITSHDLEVARYGDTILGINYGILDRALIKTNDEKYQEQILDLVNDDFSVIPMTTDGLVKIPNRLIKILKLEGFVKIVLEDDCLKITGFNEKNE